MTVTSPSPISLDLARVADRVAATAVLGTEFCDRLTRSLSQLYGLARAALSETDLECFDAILIRIAPTAPVDARLDLSDRLSTAACPPRRLLLVLAHDLIEVARPLLENSPALTEDDLVEIARSRGVGHMEAIAERSELSPRVTDILVLRGDDVVRRIVSGNLGARFSDKGFTRLSLQAREDLVVETRLIGRDDLPDVVIHYLLQNGSPNARQILIQRAGRPQPAKSLGSAHLSIRVTEDGWLEPYDFDAAAEILGPLKNARHQLDGFVRRLAQTDCFPEIVHVLADVSGLPLTTMKHILVGLDTEPFAVVARAAALKVETVREILATGPWLHRLDARAREAAALEFQAMNSDDARKRLRRWAESGRS